MSIKKPNDPGSWMTPSIEEQTRAAIQGAQGVLGQISIGDDAQQAVKKALGTGWVQKGALAGLLGTAEAVDDSELGSVLRPSTPDGRQR